MRNSLGGVVSAVLGSISIVLLLSIPSATYPDPFGALWILFEGSVSLQSTFQNFINAYDGIAYITTWLLIGFAASLFSRSEWNAVRTVIWTGVSIAVLSVTSRLLTDPFFWSSTDRNIVLLVMFMSAILASLIALVSSIPAVRIISNFRKEKDPPPPERIETVCQCGAVYKSHPKMCAKCGRSLSHSK